MRPVERLQSNPVLDIDEGVGTKMDGKGARDPDRSTGMARVSGHAMGAHLQPLCLLLAHFGPVLLSFGLCISHPGLSCPWKQL
jgi:hypothetical protein